MYKLLIVFIFIMSLQPLRLQAQTPTPLPTATPIIAADRANNALNEANSIVMPATTNGDQVYYGNRPLLPDIQTSEMGQLFSYMKWATSTDVESIFGPFAPPAIAAGVIITLAFVSLILYVIEVLLSLLFAIALFTFNLIMKFAGLFF